MKGLSCRWNAIPNKRGCVMSLLVLVRNPNLVEVYDAVIEELKVVYDGKIDDANPVNTEAMDYKSLGRILEDERRDHASVWSFRIVLRLAEILAAVAIFRLGLPPLIFNKESYRKSMRVHSDFRKFDDMLRMIIDCSQDQAEHGEPDVLSVYT